MIGPFQDESALLVPVPEAEPVVAEWRDRLDPSGATGVPAHITVLYPFLPPAAIDEGSRAIVGQLASAFSEFDYELAQAGWFGRKVLWLAPAPAEPSFASSRRRWSASPRFSATAGPIWRSSLI
jgi:hypothetical protein